MQASRVNTAEAERRLEALKKRAKDLRPVFREMRPVLRQDIADHFARGAGPSSAWPPRARSSFERIRRTGGNAYRRGKRRGRLSSRGMKRFLNQLGRLKGSYKYKTSAQRMEMWSRVPWAGVHQHGGTAGKGSRIPARPFMWASRQALQRFANLTARLFGEAWLKTARAQGVTL